MGSGPTKILKPNGVSRDDASKEGTTPKAPSSLVQEMDMVVT
jgi:hypothetical protein